MAGNVARRSHKTHLVCGLAEMLREFSPAADGQSQDAMPALANALLLDALRERATDIHFEPQSDGMTVRLRIDGLLYDALLLTHAEGARIVRHFKAVAGLDSSQHFLPGNARETTKINGQTVDLRIASLPCARGEAMTIRLLDRSRVEQRLDQLGLQENQQIEIAQWLQSAFGMFLVAGPTGHGKTTTLYALLHELRSHDRAIYTIEEPIEYELDGITQTQVDRKHGLGFSEGLRAILRLDPDYLLLGEIRGPDSARAAAEAAGNGRVLMSTIHSPDSVGVVTALRGLGISDREISVALNVVVAQRLIRKLCPSCHKDEYDNQQEMGKTGCDQCRGLGYLGRTGIFEVWRLNEQDRSLILEHADEWTLRRALAARGFKTLVRDGNQKVTDGITSSAEVRQVAASYPHSPRRNKNHGRVSNQIVSSQVAQSLTHRYSLPPVAADAKLASSQSEAG